MTLVEVMSYWADSWFLTLFRLTFSKGSVFFCPSVLSIWGSFPSPSLPLLSCPHWNWVNTYLNPLYFLKVKNRSVLMRKTKGSPAVPKFALRNYAFVVVADNQRCLLTCLLLPPINFVGFLAAVPGSSEDNADLGKTALFLLLTYWAGRAPETTTDRIS